VGKGCGYPGSAGYNYLKNVVAMGGFEPLFTKRDALKCARRVEVIRPTSTPALSSVQTGSNRSGQ
jgi:hypothetical protein